jgi:hypothetical protein
VHPSEGALDDPTGAAETGAVSALATGDAAGDAAPPQLTPTLVVVVAAVSDDAGGPPAWPANLAANRRHALDERNELGYVVAIAAGDRVGCKYPIR